MKSILLVEDDSFLIDIYKTKLEEAGFKVEIVESGDEVLPKLKEKIPDLLVLDIVLPRIDGWELLNKIKKTDSLKDLKVIILSNLSQKNEVEKGLKLGAAKYLIKAHYIPTEIVEEIKEIIK